MAYRYTNTEKWNDAWFVSLSRNQKLLFLYLCDNCDIAGFIEVNIKRWQSDLDFKKNEMITSIKGLSRGLIISELGDCAFIRNYLKHQKNLPLNDKNNAHLGIIKRFDLYKNKFKIQEIQDFINQDVKPLTRGYGNGNGNGNDVEGSFKDKEVITWRNDFDLYLSQLRDVYNTLSKDSEWISQREEFLPNVDILLTLKKACVDFWATKAGWENKKNSKTKVIDWKATLTKAVSQQINKVYKNGDSKIQSGNTSYRKNTAGANAEDKRRSVDRLADMAETILQNLAPRNIQ